MHEESLLTVAPAPIRDLPELYATALHQAELAARRYGALAAHPGKNLEALRPVFEALTARENIRINAIKKDCIEACGAPPDMDRLPATFMDVVPAQELADISQSSLSTPYTAWALAVRHRRRAFIYWTYVAALTKHPPVSLAAESLAREALVDANLLRRERRLAWQDEHKIGVENNLGEKNASAALLESLLRRDVLTWSQTLPPEAGRQLLYAGTLGPSHHNAAPSENIEMPALEIEQIKRRALRRAEQLLNVYLDEADRAKDQSSLEFAQELASRSIARLAGLRAAAASPPERQAL